MGLRNLDAIANALLRGGLPAGTPAAVIASATLVQQRVLVSSLECIAADARTANLDGPTLVVIGDIVKTRQEILDTMARAGQTAAIASEGVAAAASTPCAN
jgi:uroporphyrin-III C-methyltransferase